MAAYRGAKIKLPHDQEQVVIGTILGDGHLGTKKGNINATLIVVHKEKDKDYIWWKYKMLKDTGLTPNPPRLVEGRSFGKPYRSWRLESRCCPYLTELHNTIYKNGRKTITHEILEKLDLLGLAVWYQDDGSVTTSCHGYQTLVRLSTDAYGRNGAGLIKKAINEKFGLDFRIYKHGSGIYPDKVYWILMLYRKNDVQRFFSLVSPHIHPSMSRKLSK